MKKILKIVCLIFAIIFLNSCYDNYYFKDAKWNCDNETFLSYYDDIYYKKICDLKEKYSISCQDKKEIENRDSQGVRISYYLYNEIFTIELILTSDIDYSKVIAYLYYYGEETPSKEYKDFENIVNLLNDFVNYVSYDAKTDKNYFETLYNEAINKKENLYASYNMHFDHTIGNLYYLVQLDSPKGGGYYYMLEKNEALEKENYRFEFRGLLKPIERTEDGSMSADGQGTVRNH